MAEQISLNGTWTGRIIDIRGLEAELTLDLHSGGKGEVRGSARAVIQAHHEQIPFEAEVSGTVSGRAVSLAFEADRVSVKLDADLVRIHGGGSGMKGVYDVAAEGFSTLRGGVFVVSKGIPATAELVPADFVDHSPDERQGR